jgi:hypothetical protein
MSGEEKHRDIVFAIDVDRDQELGTYANFLNACSSPYEFTLDFCETQEPYPADPDDDCLRSWCAAVSLRESRCP